MILVTKYSNIRGMRIRLKDREKLLENRDGARFATIHEDRIMISSSVVIFFNTWYEAVQEVGYNTHYYIITVNATSIWFMEDEIVTDKEHQDRHFNAAVDDILK